MTTSTFEADLRLALDDASSARAALVSTVQKLKDSDLELSRRGSWPVRRILEHVIESDRLYAMAISSIRKCDPVLTGDSSCEGQSIDEILCLLDTSGRAIHSAVKDVSEDDFYRIERLGRDEYSVLSILENVAHHDREHTEQILKTAS